MSTTIIIPNYNGAHFMVACLESLKKQTVQPEEIIVVDNASSDESVELLTKHYPQVRVIANEKNLGFAAAVNIGIKASRTNYVLLLNNDTESEPGMIEYMEQAMRRNPRAFSVASKMIRLYEPELLDSAGDFYTIVGWGANRGTGRPVGLYGHSSQVFSACAGAALYRRKIFDEIGFFDESHFAYLEDIDICYRARLFGYTNVYAPKARVRHVGSGTSGSKYNSFKVHLSARNSVWLNYKNMPNPQLILNAFPLALGYVVKAAFFAKRGFLKDYLRGLKDGFCSLEQCARVHFTKKQFLPCLLIQLQLNANFLFYCIDWFSRKAEEAQRKTGK